VRVALISTYELGRQPFGLASPAAWLRKRGHDVICVDTSRQRLPIEEVAQAGLVALYLPMHTATRLALPLIRKIREVNATARLCCYGLYAPMNEKLLRAEGVHAILGGEFEEALTKLADGEEPAQIISLDRLHFIEPDRSQLPPIEAYASLEWRGAARRVGSTEASRGCKYLCRHCPVVPIYNGNFRIVQRDVVLADIRGQVAMGAEHITFGDPDFFNGPSHAMAIVDTLHEEFPELTYDVTIKIEHLLKHRALLPRLASTGCLFVTSAVESLDDRVLALLEKGHTRADFLEAAELMRGAGLSLAPTFVTFTPWTTLDSYRDLLETLVHLDLVGNVAPIQLAIRLLIPEGSRLLELAETREKIGPFDPNALSYQWRHANPELDALCQSVQRLVQSEERRKSPRRSIFTKIWELAQDHPLPAAFDQNSGSEAPHLSEPWYCCAEPTPEQLGLV
jgi:radical SAM superfamily enzyme YgiQ (UPF0313 family)